ncbi:MAG TPA: GntR family transcriptional regulator, partial [Candidatus Angelobacter sp.]|nr:GntR family transcriptional regulator [Candidatus Angelobacter sp.]
MADQNSHYRVIRYSHFNSGLDLMKRVSASFLPPIALDSSKNHPIYRQLYDWFRLAIHSGQLRPGQRVPSTRSLAAELMVSRIPVSSAYEQLQAEGYLETFVGAGTCVASAIPDETIKPGTGKISYASRQASNAKSLRKISSQVALMRPPTQTWSNKLVPFRVSLPALEHFPTRVWSQLLNRYAR